MMIASVDETHSGLSSAHCRLGTRAEATPKGVWKRAPYAFSSLKPAPPISPKRLPANLPTLVPVIADAYPWVNSPLIGLLRIDQWNPLQGLVRTPSHPELKCSRILQTKMRAAIFLDRADWRRGLRIPDLRARDDSPLNGSCHQGAPAICLTRRLPAQRIRRCGLNATFRTRLQQCDGSVVALATMVSRCPCCAPRPVVSHIIAAR
jgi:hypothetical protein